MLTATTCEVRNYQRALDPDTASNALAGGFYGASTQDVLSSRAKATTYTNTTGQPLFIYVSGIVNIVGSVFLLTEDSIVYNSQAAYTTSKSITVFAIVPNGKTYIVNEQANVLTLNAWVEVRL